MTTVVSGCPFSFCGAPDATAGRPGSDRIVPAFLLEKNSPAVSGLGSRCHLGLQILNSVFLDP